MPSLFFDASSVSFVQKRPSKSRALVSAPLPYDMQVPLSSAGDTVLIGSMYEVYDAPPGSRYLIRLPGCDLNQATLRVGVVDIDGYTEGANLSVVGLHFSRPCAPRSVPDWATLALHRLLDFPPFCGRIQPAVDLVAAPPQGSVIAGSRCLSSLSPLIPPLLELRDSLVRVVMPIVSVVRLLRPRLSDLLPRARRALLPSHREILLMNQWGVPHLPVPAVLIFGHLERKVRAWLRTRYPLATGKAFRRRLESCVPPPSLVHSCVLLAGSPCSTLSSQRSGLPIRLVDFTFLTLSHLWSLFGFPRRDPLLSVLRRYSAPVWHHMLCSGVSHHTMAPVLTFLRSDPTSPLCGLAHWRVVTAFSGPDTFTACLRSLSPPQLYTLLAASDPQACCRSAILAVHRSRQSEPPVLYTCATSLEASHAPYCDLVYWGFPCVIFSDLNRFATDDDIANSISLFDSAFGHLRLRRPPVFIFENVASLMSARLRFVVDRFLSMINSLGGYRIHLSILCSRDFGSNMTRPRLIVVALRSGE